MVLQESKNKYFTIKTIGCKVNTYESNKIKALLIKAGLIFIDVNKKSEYTKLDYYIINTCSVTAVADKKSRQMIHNARALNNNIEVIALGCYVNSHIDNLDKDIDKYFLNKNKYDVVEYIKNKIAAESNLKNINDIDNRIREFVKIQDGCNEYCTYCIIPYLRGNIVSRNEDDIIDEIKEFVKNGTKEIVLTGIHLSSYGIDLANKTYESENAIDISRESILKLIKKIAEINVNGLEVERIRLGSLEPRLINEYFIKSLLDDELKNKFCYSFCLSLQSGLDKTLKRMNRHYTTTDFENACATIRKYLDYATITTDIIVGFPGESDDDFAESLEFVKRMRFYNPNIFPYSKRKGTKAYDMKDQVDEVIKHKRVNIMIEECDKITKEIEMEHKKLNHSILVERKVFENGKEYKIGYTKEYIKMKI